MLDKVGLVKARIEFYKRMLFLFYFSVFEQSSSADESLSKSDSLDDPSVIGFQLGGSQIDLWPNFN